MVNKDSTNHSITNFCIFYQYIPNQHSRHRLTQNWKILHRTSKVHLMSNEQWTGWLLIIIYFLFIHLDTFSTNYSSLPHCSPVIVMTSNAILSRLLTPQH
jgi:hypothetical protein